MYELFIFAVGLIVGLMVKVTFYRNTITRPENTQPDNPQIVVNVPNDLKFESLPPTEVEGARAALWYQVYRETLDQIIGVNEDDVVAAVNAANDAVDKVFNT